MLFYQRNLIKGFIVETGNSPSIECMDGKIVSGWLKKSLRGCHSKSLTSIALGDQVDFEIENNLAIISAIEPPKTILCRESVKNPNRSKILASNLDMVIIVISVGFPETPTGLIDRMIVASLSGGLSVILCFNKIDCSTQAGLDILNLYEKLPYPLLKISAKKKENLLELRSLMHGKKSILLGTSGVGKSTIIKSLTGLTLTTSNLNTFSGKGRHTTTISKLYKLEENTYLADIPGIKQLGFVSVKKVDCFFPEIFESASKCQFSNCTHTKEEKCQVKMDLLQNKIDPRRFESFQKMGDEINKLR